MEGGGGEVEPYLYVHVGASPHLYVCMYPVCVCARSRAPSALPGASLIFTRLHYPWQMEYICVRLLRGERVGQINVFN